MRSVATWLVVGALLAVALVAAVDALRGGSSSAPASAETEDVATRERAAAAVGPPRIEGNVDLAPGLTAEGIGGLLYLTDAECRLWVLSLPTLTWLGERSGPVPDCAFAVSPQGLNVLPGRAAWDRTGSLGAVDVSTSEAGPRIEVSSPLSSWTFGFEGSSPAFKPDGTLTFVREGELWGWVEKPCSAGMETVVFRSRRRVERCARVLMSRTKLQRLAPSEIELADEPLREALWLDPKTLVMLLGDQSGGGAVVMTVTGGRRRASVWFSGMRASELEASPRGTHVALRLDGDVALLDRNLLGPLPGLPEPTRAIAWPQDQRFTVVAGESSVFIIRRGEPQAGLIEIPIAASDIGWAN